MLLGCFLDVFSMPPKCSWVLPGCCWVAPGLSCVPILLLNEFLVGFQIEFLGRPSFSVIQDEFLVKHEADFMGSLVFRYVKYMQIVSNCVKMDFLCCCCNFLYDSDLDRWFTFYLVNQLFAWANYIWIWNNLAYDVLSILRVGKITQNLLVLKTGLHSGSRS